PDRLGPALEWKIDAYKIVGGEKQFMGAIPCSFQQDRGALNCITNTRTVGYWNFIVKGDSLTGSLHLGPEKTLFRNVSLKKSPLAKTSSSGNTPGSASQSQL